jgi:pimeloyl-ACP methyl ester carboxylesterase
MNPFYFGSTARRIFGLYEPASSAGTQPRCAVLCHPWGHEYLCAHRAMRQLSTRLTSVGFHTLRFDYFGTGDSGGEAADADLAGWECDASFAIDEIQEIVGQAKITLIGLRLGAVVAARLAAKRNDIIDALVLWDPVISGEEYLAQIGATESKDTTPVDEDGNMELYGFPLTEGMIRDIRSIQPECLIADPMGRVLSLVTERLPSHERFAQSGSRSKLNSIEFMSDVRPWLEDTSHAGHLPVGALQRIVDWLA